MTGWTIVVRGDLPAGLEAAMQSNQRLYEAALAELEAERKAHEADKAVLAAVCRERDSENAAMRDILEQALGVPRYQYRFKLSELARMLADSDEVARAERDDLRRQVNDLESEHGVACAFLQKEYEGFRERIASALWGSWDKKSRGNLAMVNETKQAVLDLRFLRESNTAANARLSKVGEALEQALGLDPAEPHELDAMVGELIEGYKARGEMLDELRVALRASKDESDAMKREILDLVNSLPTEAF